MGAQWFSGRVLDLRPRGPGFEPYRHHCIVSMNKSINPSLVLFQPRKARPYITERLLMGRKESNKKKKRKKANHMTHTLTGPPDKSVMELLFRPKHMLWVLNEWSP